jgi:ABC-type branched-subunit amino acid transport system ATPase component
MARSPKVLLLDEPNVGLTGAENTALVRRIAELDRKITVVLVAHDMDMVFGFAERVIVMQRGKVVVDGSPEEVRRNQLVADIYFGTGGEGTK